MEDEELLEFLVQVLGADGSTVVDSERVPISCILAAQYAGSQSIIAKVGETIVLKAVAPGSAVPSGWPAPVSIKGAKGDKGDDGGDASLTAAQFLSMLKDSIAQGSNVTITEQTPQGGGTPVLVFAATASGGGGGAKGANWIRAGHNCGASAGLGVPSVFDPGTGNAGNATTDTLAGGWVKGVNSTGNTPGFKCVTPGWYTISLSFRISASLAYTNRMGVAIATDANTLNTIAGNETPNDGTGSERFAECSYTAQFAANDWVFPNLRFQSGGNLYADVRFSIRS